MTADELDKRFQEIENIQKEVHRILHGNFLVKLLNFRKAKRLHNLAQQKMESLFTMKLDQENKVAK